MILLDPHEETYLAFALVHYTPEEQQQLVDGASDLLGARLTEEQKRVFFTALGRWLYSVLLAKLAAQGKVQLWVRDQITAMVPAEHAEEVFTLLHAPTALLLAGYQASQEVEATPIDMDVWGDLWT